MITVANAILPPSPSLIVHRSAHEIGGNCIEIAAGSERLILDAGKPLDASPGSAAGLVPKTLDLSRPVTALLISHPHQDHYGILADLPTGWPVACGRATERLIRLSAAIGGEAVHQPITHWRSGEPFDRGSFRITPYLIDHSAFDAYMLLIEVAGRRVLYTGDFRLHGRKGELVRRLMRQPPGDLDLLIMEGTNLGSDKPHVTEEELESRFVSLFRRTEGRVFVAWSAQNIDRTVTLYRACLKTGRSLVVDLYTADVMETLADFGRLPKPGWRNTEVVVTSRLASMYRDKGRGDFVDRMARQRAVPAGALAGSARRRVIAVRRSLIADYEMNGVRPTAADAWSFSSWSGYLANDDGRMLAEWFDAGQAKAHHVHTSGHASPADLRKFAMAMAAKRLVPIHSLGWDSHGSDFPSLCRLSDGQVMAI
ncbi:MAG TPA: MBL fold metallo-hydrolase [Stellaceae bacterium]|nr:MBL fold metallo-hydrolase [Stellaceae bacterium]